MKIDDRRQITDKEGGKWKMDDRKLKTEMKKEDGKRETEKRITK